MSMTFVHDTPNLVGECQKIICTVHSNEDSMRNCEMKFWTNPPVSNIKEAFLYIWDDDAGKPLPMALDEDLQPLNPILIPNLEKNSKHEVTIYVRSVKPDKRSIVIVTEYNTSRDVMVSNRSEISILSESPFKPRSFFIFFFTFFDIYFIFPSFKI